MVKNYWKPIIWLIIIIVLSLSPGDSVPKVKLFPHADKLAHFAAYMVLGLLFFQAFLNSYKHAKATILTLIIIVSVGWLLELLQAQITQGRNKDMLDLIANILGGLSGILVYFLYLKRFNVQG